MKVSVIIPVYNASAYLHECIASALAQHEVSEVILVDDQSTDDSLSIARNIQQQDNRVVIYENTSLVRGAGVSRNIGIKKASNEWIAFLDADDFYLPGRFSLDKVAGTRNQLCDAVYRSVIILNDQAGVELILHGTYQSGLILRSGKPGEKIKLMDFLKGGGLHLNGLTVRRDALLSLGGFDEQLLQGQDSDFIFRFLTDNFILNVDSQDPGAVYRVHDNNTIRNTHEGVFYRRQAARKHLKLCIRKSLPLLIFWKVLRKYLEYDFLLLTGNRQMKYKGLCKGLLLPIILVRSIIKIDTPSYKNR
jgi:glycosyltransferase involved in cell wall biosynthesis